MKALKIYGVMGVIVCITSIFFSCRRDSISDDASLKLSFSEDTLSFDTVISNLSSSTRFFKIYNNNKENLRIATINLKGGSASPFRMNLNGSSGTSFSNVELRGGDSIWVFVEVTVNQTNATLPFVVEDEVGMVTNGNEQKVTLHAYGQNAIFHFPTSNNELQIEGDELWSDSLPHVVYGKAVVSSGNSLTLAAGAKVYFHGDASLWIDAGGRLSIDGTTESPVCMQGDRLEEWYKDQAGQWYGLVLDENSRDVSIAGLQLKNATVGLYCNAIAIDSSYSMLLSNTTISNCSKQGLWMRDAKNVLVYNTEVVNCGSDALKIEGGKDLKFWHCNFSNYSNESSNFTGSIRLSDYYTLDAQNQEIGLVNCIFQNSIVSGVLSSNVITTFTQDASSASFDHCLVKHSGDLSNLDITNSIVNESPQFRSASSGDFNIEYSSPALNAGNLDLINDQTDQLGTDLAGNSRFSDGQPDIGAREFVPEISQ